MMDRPYKMYSIAHCSLCKDEPTIGPSSKIPFEILYITNQTILLARHVCMLVPHVQLDTGYPGQCQPTTCQPHILAHHLRFSYLLGPPLPLQKGCREGSLLGLLLFLQKRCKGQTQQCYEVLIEFKLQDSRGQLQLCMHEGGLASTFYEK